MKWSSFYENYLDWDEYKLIRCINLLENLGPVNEIIDVINFMDSKEACNILIVKAMKKGIRFSLSDIKEVIDWVDKEIAEYMISVAIEQGANITSMDIDELDIYVDDKFFNHTIIKKFNSNPYYTPKDILEYADYLTENDIKNLALKCKVNNLGRYLEEDFMEKLYRKYGFYTEVEEMTYTDYDEFDYIIKSEKKRGFIKGFIDYLFVRDTVHKLLKWLK